MRSLPSLRVLLVLSLTAAPLACFPEYGIAPDQDAATGGTGAGGTGGAIDDMVRLEPGANAFAVRISSSELSTVDGSVRFSTPFYVDVYEVTVGRFMEWDGTAPCDADTCTLDPGGPYEEVMVWDPMWNPNLNQHSLSSADCQAPYMPGDGRNTWEIANGDKRWDLPMTCVTWYEAAAFCFSEGKRLLTQAEWIYAATGGNALRPYPWGSTDPVGCSQAIWHDNDGFCGFPIEVGSAPAGATEDGIQDMVGSVFEWVWDVPWTQAPTSATDFAGPDLAASGTRTRRGGAYIVPEFLEDDRLRIEVSESWDAGTFFADAGFRCARSATQ